MRDQQLSREIVNARARLRSAKKAQRKARSRHILAAGELELLLERRAAAESRAS